MIRSEPGEGSDAALVSGLMGPAFVAALAPTAAVGLVLEFGTRPLTQVMLALQADNWLAQHGDRGSPEGGEIVRRMREAFLVDEDGWKDGVCLRAKEVVDQALRGMAELSPEAVR